MFQKQEIVNSKTINKQRLYFRGKKIEKEDYLIEQNLESALAVSNFVKTSTNNLSQIGIHRLRRRDKFCNLFFIDSSATSQHCLLLN